MSFIRRLTFVVSALVIALGGLVAGAQAPPFDLDTGDPLREALIPRLVPVLVTEVSPALGDVTLVNRVNSITILAMMDALVPYHPSAVGAYTRLERQPESARTQRNMNIASLHAAYHALASTIPSALPVWREMLTSAGLDPDDASMDANTPQGIGNLAGLGAVAGRLHDGYNQLGDYADTTGYAPVNTPTELRDPARWQPDRIRKGIGIYSAQQFVTPQMANVEPFADFDPREIRVPAPADSDPANAEAYKAQADEVLAVSANLTDEQKMLAEIFDNKVRAFGASFQVVSRNLGLSISENIIADFLVMLAIHDATIPTWQEKRRWDAVRPFSAIKHLYGDELVTAWGGPGKGTIELPASQWQSYLQEADHPEYPSGSACVCEAQAQAMRRYTGTDELNWVIDFPAGSSRIEPGITPAQDLQVTIATWSEFSDVCGKSRVWAGVHFWPSISASADVCGAVGDATYEYFAALIDGTAPERAPAQALPPDLRMNDRSS
ncbi:MAG: vanadium-dependent haloperoxidase [Chloroflexi bacterium]|nr:vanadium-dependent haloperoxidase [Chloroflexota bacterium]MCY3582429.1 vanadium-dependent haloperoxidase [Chloroflexota bacterium]MCY3716985.1 vanadium-dependent haloperoxidase [Chloroflexota bacterium]MDE2649801.1 vanadium-dependent haloperoxidase [Chloroflexota bacterium]MXV92527.1 vanadium-dependent haloperoxidase [Chloroflexota bacterium]